MENVDALETMYGAVIEIADSLSGDDLMRPSRCAGWAVSDVLFHLVLDARRALCTFASPSDQLPDVDAVTYWQAFQPGTSANHARYVRISASAYSSGMLALEWRETAEAAVRAAQACPYPAVTTQGHVLKTADFVATLVVEAAVHHLDMTVELAAGPPPASALRLVRQTLDGLLGTPLDWDDRAYALKGTGRMALTDSDRGTLGPLAARFPLFG
jgi:hypothetical protein